MTNEKLAQFPETLKTAKTLDAVTAALIDVENSIFKTVLDSHVSGQDNETYTARDFLVGERNTRGLSWKLGLLSAIAAANFCAMVRVGVHGGTTKIVGQPSNIDTVESLFNALAGGLETVGQSAFQTFNDGRKEGEPAVHKVGWVNQFMLDAPGALTTALAARRDQAASGNAKLAKTFEEKDASLAEFRKTLAPVKATPAPKDPNAPKPPKAAKSNGKKTDAEIIAAAQAAAQEATDAASSTEGATATDTPAEPTA